MIEYKEYVYLKEPGKIVKACKFRYGMEDGFKEVNKNNNRPYIKAWNNGKLKDILVKESDYIVLSESWSEKRQEMREFKFIFDKKVFQKFYRLK